jgi:predicted RNase H-like nuclease (RuvC/YqgF family)
MIKRNDRDRLRADERVIVETYAEELTGVSGSPAMILVHKFGERQNAYNRNMETRMQAVQSVCRRFQGEINQLQEENDHLRAELRMEQERNRQLFEKMAHDMKVMKTVLNEVRLTARLNGNAIKRLTECEAFNLPENDDVSDIDDE